MTTSNGDTLKFETKDASQMQNALQGVAMALTAATMMNKGEKEVRGRNLLRCSTDNAK